MIHMLYSHQSQKFLKHTVKEESTQIAYSGRRKGKHKNVIRGRTGKIILQQMFLSHLFSSVVVGYAVQTTSQLFIYLSLKSML